MSGNLLASLLALIFYLVSGIFGSHSAGSQPGIAPSPAAANGFYPRSGIISSKQVNIRSAASNYASVISTINQGTGVTILGEQNGWMLVETPDAHKGWITKWLVKSNNSSLYQSSSHKTIAGYYVENNAGDRVGYKALANNLAYINMVIPFSYKVNHYGTISGNHNVRAGSLAKSSGAKVLALVNNIQGSNFNTSTIHRMLNSPTARTRAVNGITRLLISKGYHGVNIDFENVPASDRFYLTAFFRELATALRSHGLMVTASVPAKTYDDTRSPHSGAYDFRALAPYLDQLMVMAYDEHYTGGVPGPVASYPWFEKVINYALRYFPAHKVVMGIAAYGYDWTASSGKARHTDAIQALIRKYRITPKWHPQYRVPYFTYKSWGVTHQVWYENAHSTAAKLTLVKRYNLRGVAVWRLGYEDPGIWKVIREQL
jgi:spore germination protein